MDKATASVICDLAVILDRLSNTNLPDFAYQRRDDAKQIVSSMIHDLTGPEKSE